MPSSGSRGRTVFPEEPRGECEVDVLGTTLAALRECLPPTWTLRTAEQVRTADARLDAVVTLQAPDGSSASLVVEAKRLLPRRDVLELVERLRSATAGAAVPSPVPMVVARYLAPSTRERLEREGVAYADATGNLRVAIDQPALFVRTTGEDRDPWRGPGRPRGTLKGAPAARVVRTLVDFSPPYTVAQLVERSGVSTGATYRVVEFLQEEELLVRRPRQPITTVSWRPLLERWSQDYGFQRSEQVQAFLFPRGVETLPAALRTVDSSTYTLTGSLAAQSYEPWAPPRLAMLYTTDIAALADELRLRPVERGANVLLAANRNEPAFLRTNEIEGVTTAAPSQVAVDLLTGPGRSPGEGQALLDWMETDERRWRR